jgi:hypothetical protein
VSQDFLLQDGIVGTGGKFTVGVNNTRVHTLFPRLTLIAMTPVANLPPVSAKPAVSLPPASTTLVVNNDKHYHFAYTQIEH